MTSPINLGGVFQTPTGVDFLRKDMERRQEAARQIEERGGVDFPTGIQNLGTAFLNLGMVDPMISTRRRKSDVREGDPGTPMIVGGYKMSDVVPKDADPGIYYDGNTGEFVQIYRTDPDPRGRTRLVRVPRPDISDELGFDINKRLEIQREVSDLVEKGTAAPTVGTLLGVTELATLLPALFRGAIKAPAFISNLISKTPEAVKIGGAAAATGTAAGATIMPSPAEAFIGAPDNLLDIVIATTPKTKGVKNPEIAAVPFAKRFNQDKILKEIPLEKNHAMLIQNSSDFKTITRMPDVAKEEMFTYAKQLLERGQRFIDFKEMNKIFPEAFLGKNYEKFQQAYRKWARSNDFDPYPEHNFYNRLGYDPDKPLFMTDRGTTTRGFTVGNAMVDAFTNYIQTGDPTHLGILGTGRYFTPSSGQVKDVKIKTLYEIGDSIYTGRKAGGTDQLYKYVADVMSKSDDPKVLEYLGNNPLAAVKKLVGEKKKYVSKTGRQIQMLTMRSLNNVPQDMKNIHQAIGQQLADGSLSLDEALDQVMNVTGLDMVESNIRLFDYLQMHKGNYVAPGFDKRFLSTRIAARLDDVEEFSRGLGEAVNLGIRLNNQISQKIFNNVDQYRTIRDKIQAGSELFGPGGNQLDEIFARRTIVQTDNEIYGLFIQPLESTLNMKVKGGGTDAILGKALKAVKLVGNKITKKDFNDLLSYYKTKKLEAIKENPGVFFPEPVHGNKIPKATMDKLTKRFGEDIANKFQAAAKKNGYYFKYDPKQKSILDPEFSQIIEQPLVRVKKQLGTRKNEITSFDQFGAVPGTINASIKAVQDQVKSMYNDERIDFIREPLERYNLEAEEIQDELQKRLNPPRPVKFKFSQLPKLVTESPILRSFLGDPRVYGLETAELFYNAIRPGVENDVEMEKLFPGMYAMHNLATGTGVDPTPKEQTYISLIDEINRAQEKGLANFGYNVADLALSIPDAVLPTEFTEEVKRQYEEMDLAEPETFIGNIGALAVEFGIPGSVAFKIINRFKKSISAATKGKADKYLFTRKTYGLEGLPKYGVQISNVAKRVGSTSLAFGAADFVAGGPYNTLTEMFDDPLLSDKLVGQLEDVENLTGKERVAANFRNRLRYGAEGSMIGGVFPLVGPALGVIGKNVLLKPALFLGKYGVVYPANYLAIKPATYLASLDPVVLPGIARGAGAFAQFLGKDVLARLAATAATGGKAFVPSLKGNLGQLPDFQQWRMFDVASNDPLERGLRKVDDFLKWFRDSGNQALYSFNLSGGAERFIKAKSREIEKYLDATERKAYDLANGFLKRYNTSTTSPAGERHMLEQVYEYLRGNLKLSKLEPELQDISKSLKNEFDQIKKAFVNELPEKSGLRAFLESNLDKYMRASFGVFTNPRYTPADDVVERATDFMVDIINKNEDFIEAAIRGVPVTEQAQAIRAFARTNVENMINLGKREGIDPILTLKQINRQILRDDDAVIQTGEELPKVIRELLGEEKSLRASVMTTAGSLVTQTTNLKSFKEIAKHGLDNGYLFTSRAEALAAGVTDPLPIGNVPGLGGLQELATADKGGPVGLFASREMKNTIEGTGGMLDSLLQNSFYQSLIAYKAGVQTGKTVFSPATQTRNFGSAGFFPLNVGHIGGNASVTDAFKIVMDDIFGAGRVVDEADLIKRISRKIELGVLDENIVASELSAILQDIKGGKLKALGALSDRVDSSKLFKTATRVYAGGDNVWKWYGHEFYMSQLKPAFKSFDDVKRYMKDFHGVDISNRNIFGGGAKNLDDGIEEAAAYLLRETYPTYSKVPEFIKAIRKLPIGNFVSFTSEILRTSFATSAIAMKHIASDNRVLREMGYRSLSGQAITLGGVTAGVQGLAHAMTNVTPTQLEVYKQYFAPDYMKFSSLIPVTNVEDGVFEVFDISRYHPYDIVTSSARELFKTADRQFHDERIARLTEQLKTVDPGSDEGKRIRDQIKDLSIKARMGQTLDPDKITINALTQYLNAVGPLYNAVTGTFFGIPIGAEAFLEAARGKTLEGSTIWNTSMPPTEIFDRAMGHFFKTIEPGLISSGRKLLYAARGDVSGVGQPLEVNTEVFKLMGGSNVKVDILGSLDFKISGDFLASFREPKMGRDYYDTANFQQRGPEQLVREYRKQNEDAFRMQYEFYKAAEAAIDSGLLTRTQIIQALQKRIAPDSKSISQKVASFISGRYTPITYGPEGLKSRREKIIRRNPDLDQSVFNYQYFLPLGLLEREKLRWTGLKFEDFEKEQEAQQQESSVVQPVTTPVAQTPEIQTPPVQETGAPVVAPQPVAGVNPMTGLTTTETALLSPGEAAIRQRQRTTGIA